MTNDRREQIYNYIIEQWRGQGTVPTLTEIGQAVGLKSKSSVARHRDKLIKLGLLVKRANGSIRVVVEKVKSEK